MCKIIISPNKLNYGQKMPYIITMLDAYERAKEAGVNVRYNSKARRIIYGYE